jgi:hypothetical protein
MEMTHLYALIPLLVLLILSLVFWGRGLVHITTLGYTLTLAFMAISNNWELMFFPILVGSGLMAILLFVIAMTKGNWI